MVDIGLKNNPKTWETWAAAIRAGYNWEASKSVLYPSVNLQESFIYTDASGTGGGAASASARAAGATSVTTPSGTTSTGTASETSAGGSTYRKEFFHSLSIEYLLFDFGGRCASIEAARQALHAADWVHDRNLQSVILSILSSYYNYEEALALLQARKDDLKDSTEAYNFAQAKLDAGIGVLVDMLQAKANMANAQLAVEQEKGIVEVTLGQLATAMGLPANVKFEVNDFPKDFPLNSVQESVEELIEVAKTNRPDLNAAYANYLQAHEEILIAWSAGMPTLSTQSILNRFTFPNRSDLNGHNYNSAITLNIPIFEGFLHVNQTRAAAANAEFFYAQLQDTESTVMLDVVTAYYALKTADLTVKYSDEYLKFAQEAYNAAISNYREGVGTFLDVLAAMSTLADARAARISARKLWITSLTSLAYATGSLWKDNLPEATNQLWKEEDEEKIED